MVHEGPRPGSSRYDDRVSALVPKTSRRLDTEEDRDGHAQILSGCIAYALGSKGVL
jgi:hypothetical protein